jgi:light-regulated signal transduction histidine kinase (bacteriophytochrome)
VRNVFLAFGLALLGAGLAVAVALQRAVTRPLGRLSAQVRRVAQGDFGRRVDARGPRDVGELAVDVNTMRERIVTDLEASRAAEALLDHQARELARSNAELEQFAYVASHDLQEPLRKVANFCQLLERQYGDRLDERAHEYIAYAVDGAKRMQVLINDLLAFSRVGRTVEGMQPVDLGDALRQAEAHQATAIAEAGARVEAQPLPVVRGEPALLALVFQNLVGNAVKFHGDEPPRVHIGVRATGGLWELSCSDNGIGIEEQYADKIFVIFQRLHARDAYGGTGIGLAMCKKIVEYHGGRIWLDNSGDGGAVFRWTVPMMASIGSTATEPDHNERTNDDVVSTSTTD